MQTCNPSPGEAGAGSVSSQLRSGLHSERREPELHSEVLYPQTNAAPPPTYKASLTILVKSSKNVIVESVGMSGHALTLWYFLPLFSSSKMERFGTLDTLE